ncbi:MAG: hypothetical protein ACXAAN_15580 [Candidatus Thorarchaeota archaeon]|jgi:hypothetical protein
MKTYHVIIALLVVCGLAGLQVQMTDTGMQPVTITSPQVQQVPHSIAEIAPFDTAIVWSTTTGNQVVDVVVDNFDADVRDEVAVIAQNGSLFLFDDDSSLLWRLDLGSTPHTLASFDGTAATGQEILIGTDYGVLQSQCMPLQEAILMAMVSKRSLWAVTTSMSTLSRLTLLHSGAI